jgi:hypothetical protein
MMNPTNPYVGAVLNLRVAKVIEEHVVQRKESDFGLSRNPYVASIRCIDIPFPLSLWDPLKHLGDGLIRVIGKHTSTDSLESFLINLP